MTGPEHYHRAEELLREAEEGPSVDTRLAIGAAKVHATLALVAATSEQHPQGPWKVTRA